MNNAPEIPRDKRVQRSQEAILTVTYSLLSEAGIGGVSIDEVSRRSGVSKSTIYRHWPSRSALLLDACARLGTRPPIPNTGSLRGDLTALAHHLARQLESARWAAVLPSIIDAAERDPEVAELHAKLHAGFIEPFLVVAERAQAKGEIPPRQDLAGFAADVVAPFFYRRWFSREPLDEQFVKGVLQSILE